MMEAAFRPSTRTGARIDDAKKYVVSSTLARVDWNAELVRGDLRRAVQQPRVVDFVPPADRPQQLRRDCCHRLDTLHRFCGPPMPCSV